MPEIGWMQAVIKSIKLSLDRLNYKIAESGHAVIGFSRSSLLIKDINVSVCFLAPVTNQTELPQHPSLAIYSGPYSAVLAAH